MLNLFTPDQKAEILASIMMDEQHGITTRDACRAQGITFQTYIDWRAQAQRRNQGDALFMANGHGRKPDRRPHDKPREQPPTALALALQEAQRRTYPADNPEDVAALEASPDGPETPPAAPPVPAEPQALPEAPEATIKPEIPSTKETPVPPRKTTTSPTPSRARGITAKLQATLPWLAEVDTKTEKQLGMAKPNKGQPGYNTFITMRQKLMTDEQRAALSGFYNRKGETPSKAQQAAAKQAAKAAKSPKTTQATKRAGIVTDPILATQTAPQPADDRLTLTELQQAHAKLSAEIAQHPERQKPKQSAHEFYAAMALPAGNRAVQEAEASRETRLLAEIQRLRAALTALTLENLQLRGLL